MIARVKYDLRELYKYINIGSHNKYWRKVLGSNNRYLPREHKDALFSALKQYKICDDTIIESWSFDYTDTLVIEIWKKRKTFK